ncbi:MAG: GNAT family N-acetyltransferase [Chloroflexota bacterium]|nr:GNAT family N-acetyltransferase [Chloroflexota bacterium]
MPADPPAADRGPAPLRLLTPDDIPAVVALINAGDAVDEADEATSATEFRLWVGEHLAAGTHAVAVSPAGAIVGYGDVHHPAGDDGARGWVVVDPAWRGRGIGTALVAWVRGRARRMGVRWIDFAIDVRLTQANTWIAHLGYEPVRTYTRLRLASDATPAAGPLPPGLRLRTFQPAQDEAAVHGILNASFADHRNANVVTNAQMADNLRRPGFDPGGLLLAEATAGEVAGEIVGLCWCYINPAEQRRRCEQTGWINDLGVDPAYRRNGLGRALLAHGITWLRDQGVDCIELWVDSGNRAAVALYTGTGFRVNKTVVDYRHFLYAPRPAGQEG